MESADLEVLRAALAWLEQGHAVTLVTVAKTWGSSPRPAGSLLALRADGQLVGSVSGGCVEQDLVERARGRAAMPPLPRIITYGDHAEQARRVGLPCGGRLELVAETLHGTEPLRVLLRAMEARMLTTRRLCLDTGEASLHPAQRHHAFSYDGHTLSKVFGPVWRLLIIGAGQLPRYLAAMARALDYHVIVCDPRDDYARAWSVPGTELDPRMPDDVATDLAADARSAVVALTHDPKLDDMALMAALDSEAFYVGALGSRAHSARRRERLAELGVSPGGLKRLHGPVGLPLGSRTPAEIAVAILAELIAVRNGIETGGGTVAPRPFAVPVG